MIKGFNVLVTLNKKNSVPKLRKIRIKLFIFILQMQEIAMIGTILNIATIVIIAIIVMVTTG